MGWGSWITHRQFQAWRAYQMDSLNKPVRGDYYLMQVACEVRRVLSKSPGNIQMDNFRLKFVEKSDQKTPAEANRIAAMAKSIWSRRVGMPIRTAQLVEPSAN